MSDETSALRQAFTDKILENNDAMAYLDDLEDTVEKLTRQLAEAHRELAAVRALSPPAPPRSVCRLKRLTALREKLPTTSSAGCGSIAGQQTE